MAVARLLDEVLPRRPIIMALDFAAIWSNLGKKASDLGLCSSRGSLIRVYQQSGNRPSDNSVKNMKPDRTTQDTKNVRSECEVDPF